MNRLYQLSFGFLVVALISFAIYLLISFDIIGRFRPKVEVSSSHQNFELRKGQKADWFWNSFESLTVNQPLQVQQDRVVDSDNLAPVINHFFASQVLVILGSEEQYSLVITEAVASQPIKQLAFGLRHELSSMNGPLELHIYASPELLDSYDENSLSYQLSLYMALIKNLIGHNQQQNRVVNASFEDFRAADYIPEIEQSLQAIMLNQNYEQLPLVVTKR